MTDLLPSQRHLFDIPDHVAYLNCATMGPLPLTAIEAGKAGLLRKAQPWNITSDDFFKDTESLRPKLARLINSDIEGIAFVPSASYAMATAARNIALEHGQSIIIAADQFPSNVYVWRALAARTGAIIKTIAKPDGNATLSDAMLDAIGPDTGLVACSQVLWTDGTKLDLEAISRKCRSVGAALVLDLTQSCGAMEFDAEKIKPDFMVAAGYKWMFGPYSTGFMYVAPSQRNGEPLEHNWINREGSTDFTQLTNYNDRFERGAERFDMGERSNFALLPAMEAAVDLLLDWGIAQIEATLSANNKKLADQLGALGLHCSDESKRGPHYLGPCLPDHAPKDLTDKLRAEHIHVSKRGNTLRITPHLYNNMEDTDRLLEALKRYL
ncbi:MAG: aminotransferase class V-fold PLP-dependent enzyme [Hyphomonadaceae bacterium]